MFEAHIYSAKQSIHSQQGLTNQIDNPIPTDTQNAFPRQQSTLASTTTSAFSTALANITEAAELSPPTDIRYCAKPNIHPCLHYSLWHARSNAHLKVWFTLGKRQHRTRYFVYVEYKTTDHGHGYQCIEQDKLENLDDLQACVSQLTINDIDAQASRDWIV